MIEPEAAEPNPLVLELKADVFEVLEVEAEAIKELLELDSPLTPTVPLLLLTLAPKFDAANWLFGS